jgi:DNA end-binding protein Ku
MSARPIGSATIAFGLVSVPIKLYSASESAGGVTFNWLHKQCGSRLKQQYVCAKDGQKVEKDDMVKGYEFAKGQYVLFSPDELKTLEEKSTGAIDIAEFVPAEQVDRLYLDSAYFLGPEKGGERAYKLLAEALKATKRAALGQYAARGKQYLVMVRPMGNGLVMEQLHYAVEIRSISEVEIPEGEVKKAELQLAVQLIEQAASEAFRPEAYEDNVKKRMLESIQQKVEGHEITAEPAAAPETQIIDLMEALKASLAKGGKAGAEGAERKPAKRAPRLTLEKAAETPKQRKVAGRKVSSG